MVAHSGVARHISSAFGSVRDLASATSSIRSANLEPHMSSSDEIVGGNVRAAACPPRPAPPKQRAPKDGPLRIYALVAVAGGLGSACAASAPGPWASASASGLLAGFLCASAWALVTDAESNDEGRRALRRDALKRIRAVEYFGFVEYPVKFAAVLAEALAPMAKTVAAMALACAGQQTHAATPAGDGEARCLQDVISEWRSMGATFGEVLRIAPPAAHCLTTGQWTCFHSVAITRKLQRSNLIVHDEPSRWMLKRFMSAATAGTRQSGGVGLARPASAPKWANSLHTADLVLTWLEATAHLKDAKKVLPAARAFAKVFAKCSDVPVHLLTTNLKAIPAELLRRARVRLDCTAMLLSRRLWSSLCDHKGLDGSSAPSVYLFTDASPQWRGLELFASTADWLHGGRLTRRMLPLVALDKAFMDATGKCIAMLWQLYLEIGPGVERFRAFCNRVRSVTTDQGVERMIADYPCILKDFFFLVEPRCKVPESESEWLFPRAVPMPGWNHLWDLVIRRGLTSMKAFPPWLDGLKAIVSFLRSTTHAAAFARSLRSQGLDGAAALVEAVKLPGFAEWRWGTLRACCASLQKVIDTLRTSFDPKLCAGSRDSVSMGKMIKALRSDDWRRMLDFVSWYTNWLGSIMSWGQGCSCHNMELAGGASVECPWKGRRIKEAYGFATVELEKGLKYANTWGPETWKCNDENWVEMVGCVRASFHLALRKVAFLDKVPYLLARLGEPGVRDRCLSQWAACPADEHHRVTREFLHPEGGLRCDVEAMSADGSGMSARLATEVESLAAIPMDDSVAEAPHSAAARLMRHGRASKWPWIAASMRLQQNLQDAVLVPQAIDIDIEPLWATYTGVLRGPGNGILRNVRMSPKLFLQHLYHMSFAHKQLPEIETEAHFTDDPGEPGRAGDKRLAPAEGGEGQRSGAVQNKGQRKRQKGPPSGPARVSGDGDGNVAGEDQKSLALALRLERKTTNEVRLMRQFLAAALEPHTFVSIPVRSADGDMSEVFMQVLSLECRSVFVKTFTSPDEEPEHGLYTVSAQMYEAWRPTPGCPGAEPKREQDVFAWRAPTLVDLLHISGALQARRDLWLQWEATQSDLEGCVLLKEPAAIRPKLSLSSPKIPVLSLVDALHAKGFAPVGQRVTHEEGSAALYDATGLPAKAKYLQCVLALPDLLSAGVVSFPSGQPISYYALLLKTKKQLAIGQGDREYKLKLAAASDDEEAFAALLADAPQPLQDAGAVRQQAALEDGDSSDVVGGGRGAAAGAAIARRKLADAHSPPEPVGSDSDSDGIVGGGGNLGAPQAEAPQLAAGPQMPDMVLGQRLRKVKGRLDGHWSYFERLSVACNNPAHEGCAKSRSCELGAAEFGRLAPVFFLGAWLRRSDMSVAAHKSYKPGKADMRAFAQEYGA